MTSTTNKKRNEYALLNFKLEEMLRVSIERLQDLNSRFACRENSIAITKMQEALMWLNARTADRESRGVEGKHQI